MNTVNNFINNGYGVDDLEVEKKKTVTKKVPRVNDQDLIKVVDKAISTRRVYNSLSSQLTKYNDYLKSEGRKFIETTGTKSVRLETSRNDLSVMITLRAIKLKQESIDKVKEALGDNLFELLFDKKVEVKISSEFKDICIDALRKVHGDEYVNAILNKEFKVKTTHSVKNLETYEKLKSNTDYCKLFEDSVNEEIAITYPQ
jgi:hypothetical protein